MKRQPPRRSSFVTNGDRRALAEVGGGDGAERYDALVDVHRRERNLGGRRRQQADLRLSAGNVGFANVELAERGTHVALDGAAVEVIVREQPLVPLQPERGAARARPSGL